MGKGLFLHMWKCAYDLWARACFFTCRCCCTLREVSLGVVCAYMVFGQGLVSSRVEDVARREASLGFVDTCIMIFG